MKLSISKNTLGLKKMSKLFSWCKILFLRFAMPIINLVDLSACNSRVESWKNVGNVSKFGSPRMSLFLPKIIVVDCIEKMSEEIPDRLGSTAYLLNLMKAFCTHCCIQYYWLQVSAFWTQISPKKNKTKLPPHYFSPRNLLAEKKP